MGYSRSVVQSGVGNSIPLELVSNNVLSVAFSVQATDVTTKYRVEHLIGGGVWFSHPEVSGVSDSQYGHYPHPISAIRVVITEGAGAVELSVITANC